MPDLAARRNSDPFANDCYEAADYWCHLGRWVLEANTKVNYPERARGEFELLAKLQGVLGGKSADVQRAYVAILKMGSEILKIVGAVTPPKEGHLGFLRIVRAHFGFLETEFDFSVVDEQPGSIRFSSGSVYLELDGLAMDPWLSCSFGNESPNPRDFWIHDLLYLNHDERYHSLPERLEMNTEAGVESWFKLLALIFRQYGSPVLQNRPGIFSALFEAQAERDAAYSREMELKHGIRE
jgi:hypothetical protein